MKLKSAALLALFVLSGCSLLVPYDNEFACPGTTDYGKCTDVQGAYSEALGGEAGADAENTSLAQRAGDDPGEAERPASDREEQANVGGQSRRDRYRSAEYAELTKLIHEPVTPLVQPPKVLRTLVVAYATGEKTLYMPRYIFYFANDGAFVLGDYLNAERPLTDQTVYPNGGP